MAESATARVQGASFADEDMGMARVDSVWSVDFREARARIHRADGSSDAGRSSAESALRRW